MVGGIGLKLALAIGETQSAGCGHVLFHRIINDGGKHIVSVSVDSTIRTWSPLKSECVMTIRTSAGNKFHHEAILCMALHHDRPMIISGDSEGKVIASQYITGEVQGIIGKHDDSVEAIAICRV